MAPLEEQMFTFLISISAGCLAAFCFDVYRALVRFFRIRRFALGVGDILFWIILSVLIFAFLLFSNDGEMRGFMLVGLAAGVGIYLRVLGEHSSRAITRTFTIIQQIIMFMAKVLAWSWLGLTAPFKLAFLVVTWPFKTVIMLVNKLRFLIVRLSSRIVPGRWKNTGKKIMSPLKFLKERLARKKK